MSGHPDDAALIDSLVFGTPHLRPICEGCDRKVPTAVTGTIDACSGGGYDVRRCRECLVRHLAIARSRARRPRDYRPALPRCG